MSRVKIVTDTAQDFTPDCLMDKGINVVPLTVHFGDDSFLDGFELRGKAFYDKLRQSPHHPSTSQPSPAAFHEVFSRETEDGSTVVAITLSSGLSGTFQSAVIAKAELPDREIFLVDSQQASGGQGLLVLAAQEMADAGKPASYIIDEVTRMSSEMVTIFSVDTLDYLARNGRIGKAQHLLGSMLNMKPILRLDKDGVVTAVDRVRGKGKVIPRILELIHEKIREGSLVDAVFVHADAPEELRKLTESVSGAFRIRKCYETEIGAIIGTHTGPGTLAAFVVPAEK